MSNSTPSSDPHTETDNRTLNRSFTELADMAQQLDADSETRTTAKSILRDAHSNEFFRGRSVESTVAAALYIASRVHQDPRSMSEVITSSNVHSDAELRYTVNALQRQFSIPVPPAPPSTFIDRYAETLDQQISDNVTDTIVADAHQYLEDADEHFLSGRDPTGIAAAALYLSCLYHNVHITQSTISDIADTSDVTIRKNYKELRPDPPEDAIW